MKKSVSSAVDTAAALSGVAAIIVGLIGISALLADYLATDIVAAIKLTDSNWVPIAISVTAAVAVSVAITVIEGLRSEHSERNELTRSLHELQRMRVQLSQQLQLELEQRKLADEDLRSVQDIIVQALEKETRGSSEHRAAH